MPIINIILGAAAIALGIALGYLLSKGRRFIDVERTKKEAASLLEKNTLEAEKIKTETLTYVQKKKEQNTLNTLKKEDRIKKLEEILKHKEDLFKRKESRLNEAKLSLASIQEETQSLEQNTKRMDGEIRETLTKKTGQKTEELKNDILKRLNIDLETENIEKLAKIEDQLKESADRKAKGIIISVIQRLSSPTSVESRVITVNVPKDHIKGKIVGKEGQNIEELEGLLNVDIVFNDLPNAISISAFRLVQRRIAQRAIEKLCEIKGDIDKNVIGKTVKEAEKETDEELYILGKTAIEKMNIGNPDKEFARITGRLQYRTSYGQNIMKHSQEVGWLAAMIASELGANRDTCRIAGFLHDLGKAIDQDPGVDKPHDYLSKELMEKYRFSWETVHAAWTHHDAIPQETAEAIIVKAADAISASRPGARQESFDKYLERIQALQETAESYEGVKKAFALSAGREIRVIVDPEVIDDKKLKVVAKDLATKIESSLSYPGQIKVNVIRRTKHTEIAQ